MSWQRGADAVLEPLGLRPYYVVAPPYDVRSAGNRVLHLLVQGLLRAGAPAYAADIGLGSRGEGPFTGPVAAPTLTGEIVRMHERAGLCPIVVYPETVEGNPLRADSVVRYYLNFPGRLGGSSVINPSETRVGYSVRLALAVESELVLCLPVSDPREFHPREGSRDAVLAYAQKFRRSGGRPTLPDGSIEITSTFPSRAEPAALLARGRVLYVWEDTALIIEALLSGCPVVFHQESTVETGILEEELGSLGIAADGSDDAIAVARAEIPTLRERYKGVVDNVSVQVAQFIAATQVPISPGSRIEVGALRRWSSMVSGPPLFARAERRVFAARQRVTVWRSARGPTTRS